jgi:hypothetical protein
MSQATHSLPPEAMRPPLTLQLIDPDTHPDGLLHVRMPRAHAGRHRPARDAIERTPAITLDGRRMKELAL